MRHVLAAAIGIALLFELASPAHAGEEDAAVTPPTVTEIIVAAADRWGADSTSMLRVAQCESALRPDAVGDHGSSFGIFQLHRGGMLTSAFYPWGYTDALDPEQSADFTARWIALTGNWRPWTCARLLNIR